MNYHPPPYVAYTSSPTVLNKVLNSNPIRIFYIMVDLIENTNISMNRIFKDTL